MPWEADISASVTDPADVPPGAVVNRISHLARSVQFHLGHTERYHSSPVAAAERGDWDLVRYDLEHMANHLDGAEQHMDTLIASLREREPAVAAEVAALDAATRDQDDDSWHRSMRSWRR